MAETGNIKTFESPIDKLTPSSVGAEAYEMEGRHVAATYHQAGESIGGAIAGAGAQLEEHDTLVQTTDLMKKMSDLDVQAHQRLLDAKNTMDPSDTDAPNKFMATFQDQLSDIQNQTYTPKAYEAMSRVTNDFQTRTRNDFIGYQSEVQATTTLANTKHTADNYAILASIDPTTIQNSFKQIDTLGKALPANIRPETVIKMKEGVADNAAENLMTRVEGAKVYDPAAVENVRQYILDPKNGYTTNMSREKFAQIMGRLDTVRKTGPAETTAGIELNKEPLLKMVSRTGIVPPDLAQMPVRLRAIGTPEANAQADKLDQDVLNSRGEYTANQIVAGTPADKLQDIANAATDIRNNPNASGSQIAVMEASTDHLATALKARNEAFNGGDPLKQSNWVMENSQPVRHAYEAYKANPTPENFQAYYQKSYAYQRYMQPDNMPSVVTQDIENEAWSVKHANADPTMGPLAAEQKVADMARKYGAAWPQIAGDLAKKKIFNGDELVAAGLYNNPAARGFGEQLMRVSQLTNTELQDKHNITREKALAMVNPEFDALAGTMFNISNGDEILNAYQNAAVKIVQATGMEDASQFIKTAFTDQFQFVGDHNSIRIPADLPDGGAVGYGSRSVLNDIGSHDLVIPSSNRLGSINQKEAYIDGIKANGIWATSPNGRGATLYDGPNTGNPVMERNKQGQVVPVTLSFDELIRLGKKDVRAQIEHAVLGHY